MTLAGDILAHAAGVFHGIAGGQVLTLSDGTLTDAIVDGWVGEVTRETLEGGVNREFLRFRLRSSEVINVNPSPKNEVTDAAGKVWTVETVEHAAQDDEIFLGTVRTFQQGEA